MFVKPNTALSIRDPDLKDLLPADGRDVPESDYWHRRLRDQDVILVTEAAPEDVAPTVATAPQNKANRSTAE